MHKRIPQVGVSGEHQTTSSRLLPYLQTSRKRGGHCGRELMIRSNASSAPSSVSDTPSALFSDKAGDDEAPEVPLSAQSYLSLVAFN